VSRDGANSAIIEDKENLGGWEKGRQMAEVGGGVEE
jgi:hypothetical protein